jgi:hypothetical protein
MSTNEGSGRQPAMFVRLERRVERGAIEAMWIHIGRGLWYALGSPARFDVVRRGRTIALEVVTSGGYGVIGFGTAISGMPKINARSARDLIGLEDGRYRAAVEGRAIVLGERLP